MSSGYLVLDIETVPDADLWTPPDVPAGQERPFPPLYVHRPIVLGALWLDSQYRVRRRANVVGEGKDERGMLVIDHHEARLPAQSSTLARPDRRLIDVAAG